MCVGFVRAFDLVRNQIMKIEGSHFKSISCECNYEAIEKVLLQYSFFEKSSTLLMKKMVKFNRTFAKPDILTNSYQEVRYFQIIRNSKINPSAYLMIHV